ncbi:MULTISPECIES: hypothetical protein [Thermomonospora]|uniref:Uncharacterized protein n=1 Tax=Thermomonospora curvata (strain ATCC 19995 / DSM 43183 / JCM 3096 / KCTC 9072 / NBRC 15933 / NCIMB 10081 / Henssen B9) TaxID=471852 RepID=D1A7J0_THECD|nr:MULTISPECIES: hypothetical protein [Thermomonospora]ACY96579.1 hypothetical protein Tcur_0993 [Thermomonospora curvata DSM 43183]PKK15389.1 MAG: hypothetical protein BUE48_004815 [Thermomonospora sp. CIF 1]
MDSFTGHRWEESGGFRAAARRSPHDERDTPADDCATAFLSAVDEALWVLLDAQRAPACAFAGAARRHEHIRQLRRLLDRLHELLSQWQKAPP